MYIVEQSLLCHCSARLSLALTFNEFAGCNYGSSEATTNATPAKGGLLEDAKLKTWHEIADFVYSEYLSSVGSSFRPMIWQIAEDYAKADLLLRLPGYTPTPAFREVLDMPLVARHARKTGSQVGDHLLNFVPKTLHIETTRRASLISRLSGCQAVLLTHIWLALLLDSTVLKDLGTFWISCRQTSIQSIEAFLNLDALVL